MQIPRGDLVAAFQRASGIAERRDHVKQEDLHMKAVRQPSRLLHDVTGRVSEHHRNKNFLNAERHGVILLTNGTNAASRLEAATLAGCGRKRSGELMGTDP